MPKLTNSWRFIVHRTSYIVPTSAKQFSAHHWKDNGRSMFKRKHIVLLVGYLSITLSCGQEKRGNRDKSALTGGNAVAKRLRIDDKRLSGIAEIGGCDGAILLPELALAAFNYTDLDGNKATLKGAKSLCQLLVASKKTVGIYQFVGPETVISEGKVANVALALEGSPYRKAIQHFIIVAGLGTPEERTKLTTSLKLDNPDAIFGEDEKNVTFDSFSKTPNDFETPTLVAMATSTKGIIFNDNAATYLDIVPAAEGLLKESTPEFTGEKSSYEIESPINWDGLTNVGTSIFDIIGVR